jgi:protein-L-isoaspartate(D-aspartate) O-methyltransferase
MDKLTDSVSTRTRWRQVNLWCDDWQAAEQIAAADLGPRLADAEDAGVVASWWFVRKGESWRLRCLPAPGHDEQATAVVEQAMRDLMAHGPVRRWAAAIYEPETFAFGGAGAMDLAHDLFHADSRHLLVHLREHRLDHRRELGLLLCSLLMRSAGQDWYEQGDIWARVAAHRATSHTPRPQPGAAAAVLRLISARAGSAHSPLRAAPAWPAAFCQAGRDLAELAQHGTLTRGLRAVLAHHVLFAWNRAGIPAPQQAVLAATASAVVFQQEPAASPPWFPASPRVPELSSAR